MTTHRPTLQQRLKQQHPLIRFLVIPDLGGMVSGLILTIAIILFLICTQPAQTAQWISYIPRDIYAFCPAFGVIGMVLGCLFFLTPHLAKPGVAKGLGTAARVLMVICMIMLFPIGIGMLVAGRKL